MTIITGEKEYFPGVGRIAYEGPESDNPFSFRYYDENKVVAGKSMKEHFKFATCYWHTFCNAGHDPFGPGTKRFPWDDSSDAVTRAHHKNPLFLKSEDAAHQIVRAIEKRRGETYVPGYFRFIMGIVTHLPEPLFQRFKVLSGR